MCDESGMHKDGCILCCPFFLSLTNMHASNNYEGGSHIVTIISWLFEGDDLWHENQSNLKIRKHLVKSLITNSITQNQFDYQSKGND